MTRHLGLDLGGTNIKWAIIESGELPKVMAEGSTPTEAGGGPEDVAAKLVATGRNAIRSQGPIESVGIGVPGLFDRTTGAIVLFPNLVGRWDNFPLRKRLEDGLGKSVTMINDARAFTLAESVLGAGQGYRIVVAMVLGTGVGGGFTIDGKLHTGAFGTAGEFGHQTVVPDGPICGCGNRGCVEALTRADVLAGLAGTKTAEAAFIAAANGDQRALNAISEVAGYLGIALANAVTVIGPDRIVIGGGIASAGDLLLAPIRATIRDRITLIPIDKVEIVLAQLGSSAGAIGAALAGIEYGEDAQQDIA